MPAPRSRLDKQPIYTKLPSELTTKQAETRSKALEVLSLMRNKKLSLSFACKAIKITPKTVIANTNALEKIGNKWVLKQYDNIPRTLKIISNGKSVSVTINWSPTATIIGSYYNDLQKFLDTNEPGFLLNWENVIIKDIHNTKYLLETNPDVLNKIMDKITNVPEIYIW